MSTETRTGRGPFTVEDLWRTPEDHVKRELIDGWLYIEGQPADSLDTVVEIDEVSAPRIAHQRTVVRLVVALDTYASVSGGLALVAPTDVVLDGDRTLQPDVLYLGPDDAQGLEHAARVDGAVPWLVIEVSSPSTRSHDVLRKRRVYEEAGVPEFWFVDLEAERIEVYARDGDGYPPPTIHERDATVASVTLPGLTVVVGDVLPT